VREQRPIYCGKSTCDPERTSGLNLPFQPRLRVENPTAPEEARLWLSEFTTGWEARPAEASVDCGKIISNVNPQFG